MRTALFASGKALLLLRRSSFDASKKRECAQIEKNKFKERRAITLKALRTKDAKDAGADGARDENEDGDGCECELRQRSLEDDGGGDSGGWWWRSSERRRMKINGHN